MSERICKNCHWLKIRIIKNDPDSKVMECRHPEYPGYLLVDTGTCKYWSYNKEGRMEYE